MDTNAMMDMVKAMQGGGNNLSAMLPALMGGMGKGGGDNSALMAMLPALMGGMGKGGGDNSALMAMLPALMGGMGKGGGDNSALMAMLPALMGGMGGKSGGDNNALTAMLPALMSSMGKSGGDNSALTAMLPALMGGMDKGGGNKDTSAGKDAEIDFEVSREPQPVYFENKRHRRPAYSGADNAHEIDYQKIRRIEPKQFQNEPESGKENKNDLSSMLSMMELVKGMNKGGVRSPDDIAKLSQIEKFAPDNIKQGLRAILSLNSVFSDSVQ